MAYLQPSLQIKLKLKYLNIDKITDINFNLNGRMHLNNPVKLQVYAIATKQSPAKSSSMMSDWQVE